MKRNILFLTALMMLVLSGSAFSLTNFWYNGFSVNSSGQILPATAVNVRITISNGAGLQYQETHAGITTDQFGCFMVLVGTGGTVTGTLGTITVAADTKILAECQVGAGAFVISSNAAMAQVLINTTVVPGNIDLPNNNIIIGNALGDGQPLPVGGDLTGANAGTYANFQVNDDSHSHGDGTVANNLTIDGGSVVNSNVTPGTGTVTANAITAGTYAISVSGNAATATTATNLAGGANGSLPYQTGSGATSMLAAGSNGNVLTLAGGVPTWAANSASSSFGFSRDFGITGNPFTTINIPGGYRHYTYYIALQSDGLVTNGSVVLPAGASTGDIVVFHLWENEASDQINVEYPAGSIINALTQGSAFFTWNGTTWIWGFSF